MVSIILSAATAIQSIVGFGLALFAVPLLILAGVPLLPAVFLVLSVSFVSACLGVRRLRADFSLKASGVASVYRAIGVLPGYWLAVYFSKTSPANLKAAIGFAIGLGVVAQVRKMRKREGDENTPPDGTEPSKRAAPVAFLGSGVLMGWLGMGGPPLIFWLLTGRQNPKKSRVFLYGVYLLTIPFQLALMALHVPETATVAMPFLLAAIPCCLLVTAVALRVGDKLDVDRLQWFSLVLLTLLALKAFLDWFHHAVSTA